MPLARVLRNIRSKGVTIRIYSPAKVVADCFKYRTEICLDGALEALRDYRQKQRAGIDEVGALRGFAAWLE